MLQIDLQGLAQNRNQLNLLPKELTRAANQAAAKLGALGRREGKKAVQQHVGIPSSTARKRVKGKRGTVWFGAASFNANSVPGAVTGNRPDYLSIDGDKNPRAFRAKKFKNNVFERASARPFPIRIVKVDRSEQIESAYLDTTQKVEAAATETLNQAMRQQLSKYRT